MDETWLEGFVEAWRRHARAGGPNGGDDARRITTLFAQGGVWEDVAVHASYQGHDALRQMFEQSYQWSPTLAFDVLAARSGADHYTVEWEMHAQGNEAFGELPALDQPFRVRGVSIGEVGADGKVTVHRDYWNQLDWMGQVGLLSAEGAS